MSIKVMIGIPAIRTVSTDWWVSFINWIGDIPPDRYELRWNVDAKAGRIDWSRSNLIEAAKRWKPKWFLQLDTDIISETEFSNVIGICNQDKAAGYDIIASPIASVSGIVMAQPTKEVAEKYKLIRESHTEQLPFDEPWEIEWASGGFVMMSERAVAKIPQIGVFAALGGDTFPAYCEQSLKQGEDVSLFQNMRKAGLKACADPRLHVLHMKQAPIPSYRKNAIKYVMDFGDRAHLPIYQSQFAQMLAKRVEP